MNGVLQKVCAAVFALAGLAACGGGAGNSSFPVASTPPAPPAGLQDTTITSPQTVSVLEASGTATGQFTPSSRTLEVGGRTIAVLNDDVNLGLSDITILSGNAFVYVPATGATPTGSAIYTGGGLIEVTDVAESTNFEGTVDTRIEVFFNGSAAGRIDFTNFDGFEQVGTSDRAATSGQRIRINGVAANSGGLTGGTTVSSDTFTDADFGDATFDFDTVFAGPNYDEVGGFLTVTGSEATVRATFGAASN